MLSDDKRLLEAIQDTHDPKALLSKICEFWNDPDRVERMPIQVLMLHFGILTSIAMAQTAAAPTTSRPVAVDRRTASAMCHCGRPLHYADRAMRYWMDVVVANLGPYYEVHSNGRLWRVPHHYIALHGIRADTIHTLGFDDITDPSGEVRG